MINFNKDSLYELIQKSLAEACGLEAYNKTLDLNKVLTKEYQSNFIYYYKLRRDREWLNNYFNYMNSLISRSEVTFEEILKTLFTFKHKVKNSSKNPEGYAYSIEMSFASKMLHTIDTNYPIWDSKVTEVLNIKTPKTGSPIEEYITKYNELCEKINKYIISFEGYNMINIFNEYFPSYTTLNPIKKIDFWLWNMV